MYLTDPTFDTFLDAKVACAKVAADEGVLDFIKHGNGQTRPSSPIPTTSSTTSVPPPVTATTPWTLQAFYESLPRPLPESFRTNEASEINAPALLNTMVQNARGGKLLLSFFFTSDGSPGCQYLSPDIHVDTQFLSQCTDVYLSSIALENTKHPSSTPGSPSVPMPRQLFACKLCPRVSEITSGPSRPLSTPRSRIPCVLFQVVWCTLH